MSDAEQSLDEVSNKNLPTLGAFQAPIKYGLSNASNHNSEVEALAGFVAKLRRTTNTVSTDFLGCVILEDESRASLLRQHSSNRHDLILNPLCDNLNVGSPLAFPIIGRKWKKLARKGGDVSLVVEMAIDEHCRPLLDAGETGVLKKKRLDMGIIGNKEKFPVVAGSQYHQSI